MYTDLGLITKTFFNLSYNIHTDTALVGMRYSFKFKLTSTVFNRMTTDVINYADQTNSSFSRI